MAETSPRLENENPSALPPGTRLGEFELLSLLGVGGFGIVYLAFDHALEREVAVKEYMPAALAGRTETMHVSLRSQSDAETFALGLKSFVNEARLLARFDHPALLKVHRFWEANGTAYMAMPVLRGRTVKRVRQEMAAPPDEAWLRGVLMPLLGAIERLHSEGVYHRDIAPDNIQIEPDGHPVLLDFGAARRVLSDKTQTLTAILKPAYAPIEQYAEAGSVKQGPWTDLYALGATLHYLLLQRPPAPATARAVHDEASALTTQALPGCSEDLLRTIDWMLAPRPGDRPQSVAALRDVLEGRAAPPLRQVAAPVESDWDRTVIVPPKGRPEAAVPPAERGAEREEATILMPPRSAPKPVTVPRGAAAARPAHAAAATPTAGGDASPMRPVALGLGALAVAIAIGVFALWPRKPAPAPEQVAAAAPSMAAAPPMAGSPAPASAASAESTAAALVVAPAQPPVPAPAAEPVAAPVTAPAAAAPAPTAVVANKPAAVPRPPAARPLPNNSPATTLTAAAPPPAQTSDATRPRADAPPPGYSAPVVQTPAAEPPKPVAGPEARCAGRNPISWFVCMEKECLKSEQMGHADCQKWRSQAPRPDR